MHVVGGASPPSAAGSAGSCAQHQRRAIGALERLAELQKAPALVARAGVLDRADDREDALVGGAERVAERRQVGHALRSYVSSARNASFSARNTSSVSASRTDRAFSRAFRIEKRIEYALAWSVKNVCR